MRTTRFVAVLGAAALALSFQPALAQETVATDAAGLRVGPATIPPHWSKYDYPASIEEGVSYHVIERGDTLWDLSARYLKNPYLWPQVWNANPYIKDAHWIYPGDPVVLPKVALVAAAAGTETGPGTGTEEEEAAEAASRAAAGETASLLFPISEEATVQCAPYVTSEREDEGLYIVGSEEGSSKFAFADRDVLYLSRGINGGVRPGDMYSMHQASYPVRHPRSGRKLGTKIETLGWGRVALVSENSAILIVEQACNDIHAGNYVKPFERLNVPLALRRPPSDRLTPPSGKATGYVVDIADNADIAGTNSVVMIDVGSQDGVAPGNLLTVFRVVYPSVPTARNTVGELAVLTVRDGTATAKVIHSRDAIIPGDQVELR